THVHHVWRTDITDIRLHGGFRSLVAGLAWCSGDGLSGGGWFAMGVGFCLEARDHALGGAQPEIFHSAQGPQCPRLDCTGRRAAAGRQMRLDGRGRALDNVCVERWWRTVTYEEVYLRDYETPREAMQG